MGTSNVDQRASSKTKNTSKGMSYAEAWRRIKAASNAGFHFEAVTICESIISDRLLSYVAATNAANTFNVRTSFKSLIEKWRKSASPLPMFDGVDLGNAVDCWRDNRNRVVHNLMKSEPGTPTEDVLTFLVRAELTAIRGARLARAVSNWHRDELRRARGIVKP